MKLSLLPSMPPNPSIEGTCNIRHRLLLEAPHVNVGAQQSCLSRR
jgi:hypothetical protein